MRDYDDRDRKRTPTSPADRARYDAPRVTEAPADRADDVIVRCVRDAEFAAGSVKAIEQAHQANDPQRWHEAREAAQDHLASAERALDKARTSQSDASPEARQKLTAAEQALADAKTQLALHTEPPLG